MYDDSINSFIDETINCALHLNDLYPNVPNILGHIFLATMANECPEPAKQSKTG